MCSWSGYVVLVLVHCTLLCGRCSLFLFLCIGIGYCSLFLFLFSVLVHCSLCCVLCSVFFVICSLPVVIVLVICSLFLLFVLCS